MKRNLTKALAFVYLFGAGTFAYAAYDNSWYQADYWSGEYPNGISVVKEGVSVPARTAMDPEVQPSIECSLAFKGVYTPWNNARKITYKTASRIVPLKAKENFTFESDEGTKVKVKKGDTLEYLIYGSEGWFTIRYNAKEYLVDQTLLEKVQYDENAFKQDEWMQVPCENGVTGWILLSDLVSSDEEGNSVFHDGLDSWFLGFREYGQATDLTDEDLKRREKGEI